MMKLVEFFQKRPSDATIRLLKILVGAIILALLGFYFNDFSFPAPTGYELYAKYSLFLLGVLPLLGGITGMCVMKRKNMRIAQLILAILLIVLGNLITMKDPVTTGVKAPIAQSGATVDYNTISSIPKVPSKPLNIGFWIAWLSVLPLFGGITGKLITEKCLKYGEVIKKIRV